MRKAVSRVAFALCCIGVLGLLSSRFGGQVLPGVYPAATGAESLRGDRAAAAGQAGSRTYRTLAPKVTRDSNGRVTDVDFRDGFGVHTEHGKTPKVFTDPVSKTRVRYWTVTSYTLITAHASVSVEPRNTIAVFSGTDFLRKRVARSGWRIVGVSAVQAATAQAGANNGTSARGLGQLSSDAKEVYEQFKQANEIVDKLQEYVETAQHYNELYQASKLPPGAEDQAAFLDLSFWRSGIDAALKITDFKGKSEWLEDFLSRFVRFAAYTICQFEGRCVVDASGRTTLVDRPQQPSDKGLKSSSSELHGYLCNCGKDELDTMIVGRGAQAAAEAAAFVARCPMGMSNFGATRCSEF